MIVAGYLMPHAPVFIEEVGGGQARKVQSTQQAMHDVGKEIAALKPELIVVISPHGPIFTDAISLYDFEDYSGDFHRFGEFTLNYRFKKAKDLLTQLMSHSAKQKGLYYALSEQQFRKFQHDPKLDHGVLVPLHFIAQHYQDFELLAMSYGTFSPVSLLKHGQILSEAIEKMGKRTVIIASGDMSHALSNNGPYNYNENGPWFDSLMQECVSNQKPYDAFTLPHEKLEMAAECGFKSYALMMGALSKYALESNVVSYEGPFGVGYLVARFMPLGKSKQDPVSNIENKIKMDHSERIKHAHPFVKFAETIIDHYVRHHHMPNWSLDAQGIIMDKQNIPLDGSLVLSKQKNGTFVSIKKNGVLRGCIGTIMPTRENVICEIAQNAVSACSKDYRFDPITPDELDELTVSVDVLSDLEVVKDIHSLSPKKNGIIVHSKGRMGVLLPNLEGIDTIEEQMKIASNKGGFSVEEIDDMETFTVERFY